MKKNKSKDDHTEGNIDKAAPVPNPYEDFATVCEDSDKETDSTLSMEEIQRAAPDREEAPVCKVAHNNVYSCIVYCVVQVELIEGLWYCSLCGREEDTRREIELHARTSHTLVCLSCSKTFENKTSLRLHNVKFHHEKELKKPTRTK